MAYRLGVDLGTTFTAAAVLRDGRAEMATLGSQAAAVASAVFVCEDGSILVGDAALRRGMGEPSRLAREFKRRLGDPVPMLLGGSPMAAHVLMAKLLAWVVETVAATEGGPPDHVVVCHPANWGEHQRSLLNHAIHLAELPCPTSTITEPEAAATHYAANNRMETGDVVAVYDLGGGTFDAAVVEKTAAGFTIRGAPEGIEALGGIDFDQAVMGHVDEHLGKVLATMDPEDAALFGALSRLREDCTRAKEALSADTDVTIPVLLPDVSTRVPLTRAEFEAMIGPTLAPTIDALQRALRSAQTAPADLHSVLLVGGSSRIPLVERMVEETLGRPAAVDTHPKHTVALGAALTEPAANETPAAVKPPRPPRTPRSLPKISRRALIIAGAALAVAVGVALGLTVLSDSGGSTPPTTTAAPTTTVVLPPRSAALTKDARLAVGPFFSSVFRPDLLLTFPAGWRGQDNEVDDVIELYRGDRGTQQLVTIFRPKEIHDPAAVFNTFRPANGVGVLPLPNNLVDALTNGNPRIQAAGQPITRGALKGTALDITVVPGQANFAARQAVLLFKMSTSSFSLLEVNRSRLEIYTVDGKPLIVAIEAPTAQFNSFLSLAEQVLTSLSFPLAK